MGKFACPACKEQPFDPVSTIFTVCPDEIKPLLLPWAIYQDARNSRLIQSAQFSLSVLTKSNHCYCHGQFTRMQGTAVWSSQHNFHCLSWRNQTIVIAMGNLPGCKEQPFDPVSTIFTVCPDEIKPLLLPWAIYQDARNSRLIQSAQFSLSVLTKSNHCYCHGQFTRMQGTAVWSSQHNFHCLSWRNQTIVIAMGNLPGCKEQPFDPVSTIFTVCPDEIKPLLLPWAIYQDARNSRLIQSAQFSLSVLTKSNHCYCHGQFTRMQGTAVWSSQHNFHCLSWRNQTIVIAMGNLPGCKEQPFDPVSTIFTVCPDEIKPLLLPWAIYQDARNSRLIQSAQFSLSVLTKSNHCYCHGQFTRMQGTAVWSSQHNFHCLSWRNQTIVIAMGNLPGCKEQPFDPVSTIFTVCPDEIKPLLLPWAIYQDARNSRLIQSAQFSLSVLTKSNHCYCHGQFTRMQGTAVWSSQHNFHCLSWRNQTIVIAMGNLPGCKEQPFDPVSTIFTVCPDEIKPLLLPWAIYQDARNSRLIQSAQFSLSVLTKSNHCYCHGQFTRMQGTAVWSSQHNFHCLSWRNQTIVIAMGNLPGCKEQPFDPVSTIFTVCPDEIKPLLLPWAIYQDARNSRLIQSAQFSLSVLTKSNHCYCHGQFTRMQGTAVWSSQHNFHCLSWRNQTIVIAMGNLPGCKEQPFDPVSTIFTVCPDEIKPLLLPWAIYQDARNSRLIQSAQFSLSVLTKSNHCYCHGQFTRMQGTAVWSSQHNFHCLSWRNQTIVIAMGNLPGCKEQPFDPVSTIFTVCPDEIKPLLLPWAIYQDARNSRLIQSAQFSLSVLTKSNHCYCHGQFTRMQGTAVWSSQHNFHCLSWRNQTIVIAMGNFQDARNSRLIQSAQFSLSVLTKSNHCYCHGQFTRMQGTAVWSSQHNFHCLSWRNQTIVIAMGNLPGCKEQPFDPVSTIFTVCPDEIKPLLLPWAIYQDARNSRLIQSAQFSLSVLTKSNHCYCHGQFTRMQGTAVWSSQHNFHCLSWRNQTIVIAMGNLPGCKEQPFDPVSTIFTVCPDEIKPLLLPWAIYQDARNSRLIQSAQFSLSVLTKSNHCYCHGQFTRMQGTAVWSSQHNFHCLSWRNQTIVIAMGNLPGCKEQPFDPVSTIFTVCPDEIKPLLLPWAIYQDARNSRLIQSAQFSLSVLTKSNHCYCHGQFTRMQGTAVCSNQHSFSLFDLTESNHCCHGQVCMNARNGRLLQSTQFFTVWPDWIKPLLPWASLHECKEQLFSLSAQLTVLTRTNGCCCYGEVFMQRAAVYFSQYNYKSAQLSLRLDWSELLLLPGGSVHAESSCMFQSA